MPPPQPPQSGSSNTGMAVLAYLGILVVIPLVSDAKNDPFVKFHAKQGLVLLICEIVGWAILAIPLLGWVAGPIIELGSLIMIILGIINVVNGQMKELPIVGQFVRNFNF